MKVNSDKLVQYFSIGCDLFALTCSGCIVVILLNAWLPPRATASLLNLHPWRVLWMDVLALWIPVAFSLQIYDTSGTERPSVQFWHALKAVVLVVSSAVTLGSFLTDFTVQIGREFVIRFLPVSGLALYLARTIAPRVAVYAVRKWPVKPGIAVIADSIDAGLIDRLRNAPGAVFKGVIIPHGSTNPTGHSMPVIGTTKELAAVINRESLDRIILLNTTMPEKELQACNKTSRLMGVTLSWALTLPEVDQKSHVSAEYGMSVLEIPPISLKRGQRLLKRLFDVVVAFSTLLALSVLMIFIAALVKLSSKGPVLFRAARVGQGGRYFTFLKFRTMYDHSTREAVRHSNQTDGHLFKIRNDPRITPLGRFLRRYSLDELPQLLNVLAGHMSLVGPRPLPVEDLDPDGLSSRYAMWSEQRASVPPGITGLWQIKGRSELAFSGLVQYDLDYVHNWSLMLDLKILLRTPAVVLVGRGAY
jgi:exopolysaccharide biosynthesis polyprenyl glycosylphosphotransferase